MILIEDKETSYEELTTYILNNKKTHLPIDEILYKISNMMTEEDKKIITNHKQMIEFLTNNPKLKIKMKTSGTTSNPKTMFLNFIDVIRGVKIDNKDRTWVCFYPYQTFAFSQIFLQCYLNNEKLFCVNKLKYGDIEKSLLNNDVTHISATPTQLSFFLNESNKIFHSVKSISLGGERFRTDLAKRLAITMPNAKIRNIYASTETGPLLKSENEFFTLSKKDQINIKIVNNQILVNKNLVSNSVNADRIENNWYKTGDIVEFVDTNKFIILGRSSDFTNIFGNKVCLNSIEDTILKFKCVKEVCLKTRKNSLSGNIIIADVSLHKNYTKIEFDKELNTTNLKYFEKPAIVNFKDNVLLSKSGKKQR